MASQARLNLRQVLVYERSSRVRPWANRPLAWRSMVMCIRHLEANLRLAALSVELPRAQTGQRRSGRNISSIGQADVLRAAIVRHRMKGSENHCMQVINVAVNVPITHHSNQMECCLGWLASMRGSPRYCRMQSRLRPVWPLDQRRDLHPSHCGPLQGFPISPSRRHSDCGSVGRQ